LEESGVLTDCKIQTQDAEEALDFDFTSANVLNKIIMHAACLSEAFAELDTSSDVLEIHTSPDAPFFRISTFGYAGTTQVRSSVQTRLQFLVNVFRLLMI
jgi:cell cycle checkpoint protein